MDVHFQNIVRRIAGDQVAFKASARVGIISGSVDPNTYAAKVKIMPEGSITGYLPILEQWVGNGWGIVCPPSPDDQVLVLFQEDNLDAGFIWGRWYTDGSRPPQGAASGEYWLVHKTGSLLKLSNDGSVTRIANKDLTETVGGKTTVTSTGDLTITGQAKLTVSASDDAGLSSGGKLTLSASGDASLSSGGKLTLSASGVTSVTGSQVQLGASGDIANAPAPAKTLLSNQASSGPGAIVSNPTTASTATLNSTLTGGSITTGLATLVSGAIITPTDQTNIVAALMGPNSLITANSALAGHTNLLAGLTQPTSPLTQPNLSGLVGLAGCLDGTAGGFFGSAATLLPTMYTGLNAASDVTSADTYANGIVALLTADPTQVSTVVATLNAMRDTLNGYVSGDTAAYSSAQTNVATANAFLGFVGDAKNTSSAVETLVGKVMSAPTIATLQTV